MPNRGQEKMDSSGQIEIQELALRRPVRFAVAVGVFKIDLHIAVV